MSPKDFKPWDVFENSNQHLTIVYSDLGAYWRVMNQNGSFYKISKDSYKDYNFVGDHAADVKNFFDTFPMNVFVDHDHQVRFWEVYDLYQHQCEIDEIPKTQVNLLLIIT